MPIPILSPSPISLSGVTTSTWSTVASGAPAGVVGCAALLYNTEATVIIEMRGTSSTDNYTSDAMHSAQQTLRWFPIDSSGNFQYWTNNATPTNDSLIPLMWLTAADVTFPTNQLALGSTLTTAYVTQSSGAAAGAIAGVFHVVGGDTGTYFRQPTSTDNYVNASESFGRRDYFAFLDASQNVAAKTGTAGKQPYLVCYFTANVAPANGSYNATDRTPGVAGSYQNVASTGDQGPIAQLFQMYNSTGTHYAYQLQGQGAAWSAPNTNPGGGFAANMLGYSPAQANIANTSLALKEIAYFTSGSYALHSNLEF